VLAGGRGSYALDDGNDELIEVCDNNNILPLSLTDSRNEGLASMPLSNNSQ